MITHAHQPHAAREPQQDSEKLAELISRLMDVKYALIIIKDRR